MATVPKILHYIFGMAPDFGGKPWSMIHHVCLTSAVNKIKPEEVFLYYEYEPSGPWWDLSKPLVTPMKITAPTEVFGNPLYHVAHKADVVRLQKLIEHGGIYLDADVLVQRSFDDLLANSAVLGEEGVGAQVGMANAVILAEPQAPFLKRWYANYESFRSKGRDEFWHEHSVQLPSKLAKEYPDEITVLGHKAFYWPMWNKEHLDWLFKAGGRPIDLSETYANHLWETLAWDYLEDVTPGKLRQSNSNFAKWAVPLLVGVPDNFGKKPFGVIISKRCRRAAKAFREWRWGVQRKVEATLRKLAKLGMSGSKARQDVFREVYSEKLWGGETGAQFFSGVGSRGEALDLYAEKMAAILQQHSDTKGRPLTIVDLGCGDFKVGKALLERLPGFSYVGCDIVPELIAHNSSQHGSDRVRFQVVDLVSDALPEGDICLIRQVLQHNSNADIAAFLKRQKYSPLLYVSEGQPEEKVGAPNPDKPANHEVRFDWRTGKGRGVELDLPPYNRKVEEVFRAFAPPHEVIITWRVE